METKVIKELRKRVIELAFKSKEGHIGPSLSVLDILWVLYGRVLGEDVFILSKGHASYALYAVLEKKGLISDLNQVCQYDSPFGGHPMRGGPIVCSTGSLGHGFPMAVGMALGFRKQGLDRHVYCLIGDGECNEGTIWESALIAAHHRLGNLTLIIDQNRSSDRAVQMGSLVWKFEAFDWKTTMVDGHSSEDLEASLSFRYRSPHVIIAHTVKGKGVPFMENNPVWHHKIPTLEEYEKAIAI